MKNVWRRTLSLVLSGVLLLGSVPVQAFATEEVVEEVLEEVVTEPQTTQQTQTVVTATDEVANTGVEAQSNPKVDYPLVVNDEQISSDRAENILENGTAVFDTATSEENVTTNRLTLTGAEMQSVVWLYFESHKTYGPELTVYLPEDTESTITEELKTEGDLPGIIRITGEGKLNVGNMEVTGSLTVEDAVIHVTGDAHFVIGAGNLTEEGAANVGTLIGNGYYRTEENGEFTPVTEKTEIPVDAAYLEFISADHLAEGYVQTDDGKHYKICNDSECPLVDDEKPECAEHTTTSEATCAAKAVCSVCGEYGDVNADNCIRSATKYKIDEINHELVYSCCNATIEAAEPHDCEYVISEDQTSMVLTCKDCKYEQGEPIAITAPVGTVNGEVDWNNGSHPVTVNHADAKITYFKDSVPADKQGGEETAPTAPGKYIALVMVEGQELRMEFVIKQKALTGDMVTLTPDSVDYDGQMQSLPEVTVTDVNPLEEGKDYDVVYSRDNVAVVEGTEATVNAGVIKITVTGKGNYTSTAEKAFTIKKATATAALFTFTPPAEAQLAYNGYVKEATLVPKNDVKGMGETEIRYYKNGQVSTPKDVGDYEVRVFVKGTGNYSEGEVSDTDWKFTILPVNLEFTVSVDGVETAAVADNAITIVEESKRICGQESIITVKDINVSVGGQTDESPVFSVLYQKNGGEKKSAPDAGENTYYVIYNGKIGDVEYKDIEVFSGRITIAKRPANPTVAAVTGLTDRAADKGKALITVTADGEKLKYSVNNGAWTETVPTVKESGVYTIKYMVEDSENIIGNQNFSPVEVVVEPYLTATYGEMLAQVQDRIVCASGTWTFEEPKDTTEVGAVNNEGNPHNMSFTPNGASQVTKTNYPVKVYVSAAHITLDFDVVKRHHSYNRGNEIRPSVTVKEKVNANAREATPTDPFPNTEYELIYSNNKNPGKAQVTIRSKGNYVFDNPEEELTKEFIIYRLGNLNLKDDATAVPPELKDSNGKVYATGADIKAALAEKYDEKSYPKERRTYVKYLMMNEGTSPRYDEFYWPDGGSGTLTWDYDKIVTKDDNFKIYGMYTVTSERLGTEAGEIFEMKEVTDTPDVNEFYVGADGIQFKLKNYAVLCFAAEVDLSKEYKISKSITLDGKTSTKGSLTVKVDSKTATKATYGTEVTVTAKANSGYSIVSVTVTDANGKTVKTEQNNSTYTFNMPASDVTVTMKLKQTTSTSKNPYSGDTSHIYLWLTMMAASVVGIVALVILWIKKRRK